MAPRVRHISPDRLQIRQGGGCVGIFGLPFFAAGIFLLLTAVGVVPLSNAGEMGWFAWPLIGMMGVVFTAVGGTLAFGREWIVIDIAQRRVTKRLGLLTPMHERTLPIEGYTAVTLGFVEGDSDSSDQFPVGLKARTGADLQLCSFTTYAESWTCAAEVARHLSLDVEDATTDHPVTVSPSRAGISHLWSRERGHGDIVTRPPGARSEVHHETDHVRIVIPEPRVHPVAFVLSLIPIAIPVVVVPSLIPFFRQTRTPDAIGWLFIGFLVIFFGILPGITVVNGLLRARRGATIVMVSSRGVRVLQRGAWRTTTTASLDAAEIVDVDFSTQESAVAAARRSAEQRILDAGRSTTATIGPRIQRLLAAMTRAMKSRGLTVKTRSGLTTFGAGLDDDEVRYLHSVVLRALESIGHRPPRLNA